MRFSQISHRDTNGKVQVIDLHEGESFKASAHGIIHSNVDGSVQILLPWHTIQVAVTIPETLASQTAEAITAPLTAERFRLNQPTGIRKTTLDRMTGEELEKWKII